MAILAFLFRVRIAVVTALGLLTVGFLFLAFYGQRVPVAAMYLSVPSLAIGALVAFAHLRHTMLAVLSIIAPLPGMVAAGIFAVPAGLTLAGLVTVYAVAYVAGAMMSGEIVRRVLDGQPLEAAAQNALGRMLMPVTIAAVTAAVLFVGWMFRDARMLGFGAAAEVVAASLSVLVVTAFGATLVPFGEMAIAEANRTRERREPWLRRLTLVTTPRWALSLTGAALVLATLGAFGAESLAARSSLIAQPIAIGASLLFVGMVAFAVARDGREAVAATLAFISLALLCLWLWGRAVGHMTLTSFIEIVCVMTVAMLGAVALLANARRYRLARENVGVARLRAIEDVGVSFAYGVAGAAALVLPWILLHGSMVTLALLFVAGGAAGLIGVPAIATTIDTLFRRRRSAEELYGRG
ncbi:MAG: hypothetical protein JO167_02285 [Alphaproteobacteria bacterium]|nr:hypothetical protein [Alphaproteobacteria bacterium]MBV9904184.1 hypothetical protein [Alphaproteobacteria bacterium]